MVMKKSFSQQSRWEYMEQCEEWKMRQSRFNTGEMRYLLSFDGIRQM
jgi:hypothetical protein